MNWSKGRIMELIKLFSENPCLWKPNFDPKGSKTDWGWHDSFIQISITMGIPTDEVIRKITYLREHFQREREKELSYDTYKSSWFAYDSLMFLVDNDVTMDKFGTLDDFEVIENDIDEPPSQVKENEPEQEDNSNLNDRTSNQSKEATSLPRKTAAKSISPMVKEAYTVMKDLLKERQERDEFSLYGDQIAIKLRKMPPKARAMVQHIINNTMFDAELGKYDNPSVPFPYPGSTLNLQLQIPTQGVYSASCDMLQMQPHTAPCIPLHASGSSNIRASTLPCNMFPPTVFHQAPVSTGAIQLPVSSSVPTSSAEQAAVSIGSSQPSVQLPVDSSVEPSLLSSVPESLSQLPEDSESPFIKQEPEPGFILS